MSKQSLVKKFMYQESIKYKCNPEDFSVSENIFIADDDTKFKMITFGSNTIMTGEKEIIEYCRSEFTDIPFDDIMGGNNLYKIESKLREYGLNLTGEHIMYAYVGEQVAHCPDEYCYRLYNEFEIPELHKTEGFYKALLYTDVDVIGYAAFKDDVMVALAAADNKSDEIWEIGIDTLPEHRRKGLGTYLVKNLADIIVSKGKSVCYTTWGANIGSQTIAIKAGFLPIMTFYTAEKGAVS